MCSYAFTEDIEMVTYPMVNNKKYITFYYNYYKLIVRKNIYKLIVRKIIYKSTVRKSILNGKDRNVDS